MAELVSKKTTTNVVSSEKNDVCGVKSNNGLIDLDNKTPSNNQLIKLCDEKSLQELFESEWAIRICENDAVDGMIGNEEIESKPETSIKKIVLEPRQDLLDINTEFIGAEIDHYNIVQDPYTYRNGHTTPNYTNNSRSPETEEPDDLINEDHDELITQNGDNNIENTKKSIINATECLLNVDKETEIVENSKNFTRNGGMNEAIDMLSEEFQVKPPTLLDKSREELVDEAIVQDEVERADLVKFEKAVKSEVAEEDDKHHQLAPDAWLDPISSTPSQQVGQFSDDFAAEIDNQEEIVIDNITSAPEVNEKHIEVAEFEIEEPINLLEKISGISNDIDVFGPLITQNNNGEVLMTMMRTERFAQDECEALEKEQDIKVNEELEIVSEELIENIEEPDDCLPATPEEPTDEDLIDSLQHVGEEVNARITLQTSSLIKENSDDQRAENGLEEEKETLDIETEIATLADTDDANNPTKIDSVREKCLSSPSVVAPLATPDDESISDLSNTCDSESHEEVKMTSTMMTSTVTKSSTKTKKKKIEGVAGNDASQISTPRTKKTKKSKKNELEKENISVNGNAEAMSMNTSNRRVSQKPEEISDEDDLSNVNVKSLTQCYVSETSRGENEKSNKEVIETGVSIKQLCRSFGDISNADEVEQATTGNAKQTMDTQEKAMSMDDLRVYDRSSRRFSKDASVFARVSVTALRASYCSLANLTRIGKEESEQPKSLGFEKSSFNKFDALTKKSVLHVRSVDSGKVQQQLNLVGQNGDANPNCRSCGKVVFQMEQTKAEGLVWHKNCFRCIQCSKQLNVDNYESNECILYCKAHFKELFQPKPVEESDQPVRPRKPEMIIRENEPKELPPDVVRASDKPDLGLEELVALNVKSRFQVFEKSGIDMTGDIERSPSQVAVKRSPSILSKLAKFQAKGMDIGVADESLNGIPYEESSESEEEEDIEETEETETEIIKSKRTTRERPMSFSKMDDMKNRWEVTSQQGRRETQREARKEEIAGIRSRLFMGKQGKMKEMYQQAVATSERVTKINPVEEIQHSTHARSIKERFERGEPIAASDDDADNKPKAEKPDEEVFAAGISRKSRSLFLELDASAAKTGRPVTPVNPKTPTEAPKRARDAFMGRQVSDDVIRSTDTTAEVQVETVDISNKFKFFETYREPEKMKKQFRITPPRDGLDKVNSPEREIYRDPNVFRSEDRVDEVVHTDTARKMLSIFRQMEEKASKEDVPDGPKPLKRFTPPPEDKFARPTCSDSEEEEEEGEESGDEDSAEEKDPNYVRASDKVEDEFLKQGQNAVKAKTLRAKFEQWDTADGKIQSHHVAEMDLAQMPDGEQTSIESARTLRARFESLGSQPAEAPRNPKVKVNRFVEIQTACTDVCESCTKKVYPLEKVETNNKIFHKQCFRCLQCNCVLRMDTFTLNNGKLYCIPHFKQLFITRGNYDEGFGADPHKNKWTNNSNPTPAAAAPIVSNGGATPVVNQV